MPNDSDDNLFDDFDDRMDSEPINIEDSEDSFDNEPQRLAYSVNKDDVIKKYQSLKEESSQLDEIAVELRSLIMICKQMEECYTKQIGRNVASYGEIRYLHDGTILLLITIHNITNQVMSGWMISVSPSPMLSGSFESSSSCQTIALGRLLPGVRKTYQCHLNGGDPPFLLQLALIREFQLEAIRKVFHVDLHPISVTLWTQAYVSEKKFSDMNASFSSSFRLPNCLINLFCGSPDTAISIPQVIKSIFNIPNVNEGNVVLCIPSFPTDSILVKVSCAKDGNAHHMLTIGTESSRSHTLLAEHLHLHLIVEMSKLKSRLEKGILLLVDMDAISVEDLFRSMLASYC